MGLLHFHFLFFLRCQSGLRGRFLKLLGAPWALLGGPLEQLLRFGGPLGTPLVTILVSWGAPWRSHGSLGATLVVLDPQKIDAKIDQFLNASWDPIFERFWWILGRKMKPSWHPKTIKNRSRRYSGKTK